jgi:hypothetical protein
MALGMVGYLVQGMMRVLVVACMKVLVVCSAIVCVYMWKMMRGLWELSVLLGKVKREGRVSWIAW